MAIKLDVFLNLIAEKAGTGATAESARRYYDAIYDVILEELKINGEITLYQFGTFSLEERGGYDARLGDFENGGTVIRYIKPKKVVRFKPTGMLDTAINNNAFKRCFRNYKKKTRTKQIKKEEREIYNASRRKPRKSPEQLMCDILNVNASKAKEKNETNI